MPIIHARAPRVAAAAAAAVARWRALAAGQTVTTQVGRTGNSGRLGLAEDLAEALAGKDSNGGGRRSGSKDADGGTAGAAAAAASVAAAAAAKQVFKQPKAAHYSTKAISADDIRKAREKAKARAAYAGQVKSSGPGSSGGAPASPLHDATDPSAAAAAASVAAGEAPPAKRQALAPPPPRVTPMPSAFAADAGSAAPAAAGQSTSQQAHQQARGGSGGGAWQHGAPAAAGAAGGGRGQGAGAGAGGGVGGVRDLDDCPPEVLERLRRKREARHRAQLAAAKVSSRPAVQAEVVKAVVAREERAEVAAVRRAARVLKELEAAEAARDYVDAMAPTLAWPGRPLGVPVPYAGVESAPPRLPWHLLAGVCAGEESTEIGARQADADAAGLPHWVRAPPMSRTPDDAAAEAVGCREHVPHGAPEPVIPWVPADVGEMMGMNERVWDAGIRLPGYVEDPVLLQQRHGYLRPPGGSLPSASSLPSGGLLPGHGGAGQPQLTVSSPAEAVSLLARLLATPGQLQAMVAAQPQLFDPFADALAQSADPQAAALLAQLHASGVGGPHREHQRGDNGMHGGGGGHYHGPVEGAQPVALVLPTTQRYDPMYDSQQAPGQQQQRQYDPAYDTQQAPGQQQQQQPYDSQRRQQAGGRPYDAQNQQQQFPPMYDSQHPPAAGGQQQQYNDPMDTDGYYPRDPPHHHRQQQPHPHHNGARRGDYSDRAPQHHHGAGRDPGLDDGGHAAAMRAVGYRDAAPHSSSSHAGAPAVGGSSRKQYAAPASRVEERTHRYDNSQQYDQGGGGDRGGYRGGGYDRGGAAAAGEQGARQQQQQPRQRDGDPQYRYGAQYGAEGDPAPPHGDRGWQQQQQHGGGGASPHQDSEPYGRRGGEQGGGHGSRPSARR
ncbi:hypothetical protein FOA52_014361 [Chlamydomonas sp. UWO 241]|nr:hypothetical protein FOA52_014361 [Chlamydomonas sp. UWO 241]